MRIPEQLLQTARTTKAQTGESLSTWLVSAVSRQCSEVVGDLVSAGLGVVCGEALTECSWMLPADTIAELTEEAARLGIPAAILLRMCIARQACLDMQVDVLDPMASTAEGRGER